MVFDPDNPDAHVKTACNQIDAQRVSRGRSGMAFIPNDIPNDAEVIFTGGEVVCLKYNGKQVYVPKSKWEARHGRSN